MRKYFKYFPLIFILVTALFLRLYKAEVFFNYTHDNDLASWIIKDILVNHHTRLIGQQTSVLGVFIGSLFYYLQIPFYLIGRMDPFYTVFLTAILGTFSVYSFYFVFKKIFHKNVGLIAAIIYAVSRIIVFSDRGVYPTMPVMLWTVWYLYDLYLIFKGKQKSGFILFGVLTALIWHFNIALLIILPLALISYIASKKKIQWKYLFLSAAISIILSLPLITFEVRHNFQQTKAVIASVATDRNLIPETSTGWAKLDRTFQLVATNTRNIFLPAISGLPSRTALYALLGIFVYLITRRKISKEIAILVVLWQLLYIGFFSLNSLNVSEYYLDGMNVMWIIPPSLLLANVFEKKSLRFIGLVIITAYSYWNINLILKTPPVTNGYVHRKAIVDYIYQDSVSHEYPCISISYITKPGYNLGYRYFFYLKNMHVNQPSSGSPVYTIVFPLSLVNGFDKRFGDLGLILPDYSKYSKDKIEISCSGENSNLTDPMFGYTE